MTQTTPYGRNPHDDLLQAAKDMREIEAMTKDMLMAEPAKTTDQQRIERLRAVLAEALRENNVSEGSIPEFIRHVEEGTSDDESRGGL